MAQDVLYNPLHYPLTYSLPQDEEAIHRWISKPIREIRDFHYQNYDRGTTFGDTNALVLSTAEPKTSLGNLDVFPQEMLDKILLSCDLQSALRMSQVCRLTRLNIVSLTQWKRITHNSERRHCLWKFFRTGLATQTTLEEIYEVFCTIECSLCGRYGVFVHLPTMTRVCDKCLEERPMETRMIEEESARKYFERKDVPFPDIKAVRLHRHYLHERKFFPLISAKTLDSILQSYFREPSTPRSNAATVSATSTGSAVSPEWWKDRKRLKSKAEWDFELCYRVPVVNRVTGADIHGAVCRGCQLHRGDRNALILGTRRIEWHEANKNHYPNFTREMFIEHFETCISALRLWDKSENGTKDPARPSQWQIHKYSRN